ncbi:DUF4254 domain-containing protein [Nocardia sp. alder85J]|uniref:DUF4254 domain-containing protein n=1 Tax=Nocardia sp. alder85J TaxID=2862949 RepID=UPI001CD2C490|nr:DUF4254 domain-containing protein [Nocardia sp. alder85J]MCX4097791.1 DUF4254 domain-containing protein [Nocardia sp. alder85J]
MRLPAKGLVIAACCGSVDAHDSHPILPAVDRLARLHRAGLAAAPPDLPALEYARRTLMREIDHWVAINYSRRPSAAYLHTESLSSVLDRMAETQVRAWRLLLSATATDPLVHSAWTYLAELTDGYHDLVTEVESGRRRLPLAQPWEITAAAGARSRCW